jgi:hypothetical protein
MGNKRKRGAQIAEELRQEFEKALRTSTAPRFTVVSKPTSRTVVLELALTELNPTSIGGNVVKLAASLAVGPLSNVVGIMTKGSIAMEGRIMVPGKRGQKPQCWLQFSDHEKDKFTVYSLRDFQPYAHARVAMEDWARQFEEFTRTLGRHRVKESSFLTLKFW